MFQVLKMTGRDSPDAKWSENNVEGEDSSRTVNCLRGRLLAERLASQNARDEAQQLRNKLLELESLLKEEAKSRNRAEKKLKLLMKRLESMNILYVTDESERSGLLDRSNVSSASSTRTQESEKSENLRTNVSTMSGSQDSIEIVESQKGPAKLLENDSRLSLWSFNHDSPTTEGSSTSSFEVNLLQLKDQQCEMGSDENQISSTAEDCSSSAGEPRCGKPSQLNCSRMYNDATKDEQRTKSSSEKGQEQEDEQDPDNHVDDSMALVPVEVPTENKRIDPQVLDTTVKEVLESLRRAKEQLQSSMERRRMSMSASMIPVG